MYELEVKIASVPTARGQDQRTEMEGEGDVSDRGRDDAQSNCPGPLSRH
jgi:hypothetical protein